MKQEKEINNIFDRVLLGQHPEGGFILNFAYPIYNKMKLQEYDETTILKAIIIKYHEHVCGQLTAMVKEK